MCFLVVISIFVKIMGNAEQYSEKFKKETLAKGRTMWPYPYCLQNQIYGYKLQIGIDFENCMNGGGLNFLSCGCYVGPYVVNATFIPNVGHCVLIWNGNHCVWSFDYTLLLAVTILGKGLILLFKYWCYCWTKNCSF